MFWPHHPHITILWLPHPPPIIIFLYPHHPHLINYNAVRGYHISMNGTALSKVKRISFFSVNSENIFFHPNGWPVSWLSIRNLINYWDHFKNQETKSFYNHIAHFGERLLNHNCSNIIQVLKEKPFLSWNLTPGVEPEQSWTESNMFWYSYTKSNKVELQ